MCQRRIKKVKKGSKTMRLREARRHERIHRMRTPPPPAVEEVRPTLPPSVIESNKMKSRVLLELTWKTVALMYKNKVIQQKIEALKKETSDFVALIFNNPENRQRCLDNLKIYGSMASQAQAEQRHLLSMKQSIDQSRFPVKLEPQD